MAATFFTLVAAALAFAILEPIQVLPRLRLAPGYGLVDGEGSFVSSEDARGAVTLYSFSPTDCGDRCDAMYATLGLVRDRVDDEIDLGDTDFRIVTIALDGLDESTGRPDVGRLAEAAAISGADGDRWRWLGGDETTIRTVVGNGFRRFYEITDDGGIEFDPAFVLVDGNGLVRGEYRYQTLASDDDKLVRHTGILAEEIRNAEGATAVAYEAAHLFLCYP